MGKRELWGAVLCGLALAAAIFRLAGGPEDSVQGSHARYARGQGKAAAAKRLLRAHGLDVGPPRVIFRPVRRSELAPPRKPPPVVRGPERDAKRLLLIEEHLSTLGQLPVSYLRTQSPAFFDNLTANEVIEALYHPEPLVRRGALLAVTGKWMYPHTDHVEYGLEDPEPEVRATAVAVLGSLRVHKAIPALAARLRVEEDPIVRQEILSALWRLTFFHPDAYDSAGLADAYDRWWERHSDLDAAGWIAFDLRAALGALEEGDLTVEEVAVVQEVLFELTAQHLDGYSADETLAYVNTWIEAWPGGYRPAQVAYAALESQDPEVQFAAGRLLARLGDAGQLPRLIDLLRHWDQGVQTAAARALKSVGRKDLPFKASDTLQKQEADIRAWEAWLHDGAAPDKTPEPPSLEPEAAPPEPIRPDEPR